MRRYILSTRGNSITSVIVMVSILATIGVTLTRFLSDSVKSSRTIQTLNHRDQLLAQLSQSARSPVALRGSVTQRPASNFTGCLNAGGTLCQHQVAQDMELFDFSGLKVAGTSGAPARYTVDGGPCTAADTNCLFEVISRFTPSCPNGTATCDIAESVQISLTLQQTSTVTKNKNQNLQQFRILTSQSALSRGEIFNVGGDRTCNTGEVMTGIRADGTLICTGVVKADVITCTTTNTDGAPNHGVWWNFTAANCGGTLPDNNYIGVLAKTELCGDDASWQVIQPWEGGPAITFWRGAVACTNSPTQIMAVFVRFRFGA